MKLFTLRDDKDKAGPRLKKIREIAMNEALAYEIKHGARE